ncbi:MAG: cyclopropane-fatty-acyl-phospholipid synthase family protein [Gammaproteobacteria bacterium]|nr:cyclopropane-fatty-acyl-phospholipid synthase family protein [Gammaproteobacteria bacterium]
MKKLAKNAVLGNLRKLQSGLIIVHDGTQEWVFGSAGGLSAKVHIHSNAFYKKLLMHGSLGAAESYIAGDWHTDDLTALLRIIIQNQEVMNHLDGRFAKALQGLRAAVVRLRSNTLTRARRNIHAHYDLGNDFFQTFLDETLMYSSAVFTSPVQNLHQAQLTKIKNIAEKLSPNEHDHILEIGTGWGSLAIHLAQEFHCHVTTTTISTEQYRYVKARIHALNLENKITLLNQDYRELHGQFDKIVSIEMIEAVGHKHFNQFFKKCDSLLKPGGLFMLQAITMNEQSYDQAIKNIDFIKKYIFPGGCLPSIHGMGKSIAQHTRLQWLSLTDIGKHYADTLAHWHERFLNNIETVRGLGFSEEFIRTWQYYFCYCEAGFHEQYISDVQVVLQKRVEEPGQATASPG